MFRQEETEGVDIRNGLTRASGRAADTAVVVCGGGGISGVAAGMVTFGGRCEYAIHGGEQL